MRFIDKFGKKQGPWIYYHNGGEIICRFNFYNSLYHGEYLGYYRGNEEKIIFKQNYAYGKLINYNQRFTSKGLLFEDEFFIHNIF
jgi:antitoxin component YwqK of YwqJK toxin-antitoxin module